MKTLKLEGKLSIKFREDGPAPGGPAPGAPAPTPGDPVNPPAQDRWVKETVLEAVQESLGVRQTEEDHQLEVALDNLDRGFQAQLKDIEDRIDQEDHRATRKRARNK